MLTKEEQIVILKEVLELLIKEECTAGLCFIIRPKIKKHLKLYHVEFDIKDYIPLFTFSNAVNHANGKDDYYWWQAMPYDYENRILFINWIISELEKE